MTRARYDAVVVGAGPNGLTAAARLATQGHRVLVLEAAEQIGGGTRTEQLTAESRYDVCSAIHPSGAMSPAFRSLQLQQHGLAWLEPRVPLAHPLDGGRAALLHHSIETTAEGLGDDGAAYRRLVGPLAERWATLTPELLGPILGGHRHPLHFARFGLAALPPVTALARHRFRGDAAQALLAGLAGHASMPLTHWFTSGLGLGLGVAAHVDGWPVAAGGSAAISQALAAVATAHGAVIEVGHRVRSLAELPSATVTLLDVTPPQLLALDTAGALRPWARRSFQRWRQGPGVCKADYLLTGPMPWTNADVRDAGTVHVGGTLAELAEAEAEVGQGRHPDRPFVLASQPSVVDPTRAPAGKHVLWAYTHVPNGSGVDHSPAIERQLERFAPGWRDLIEHKVVRTAIDYGERNPNDVGGDIMGGAMDGLQLVLRPRLAADPYATSIPGVYLCSSSTPPGGGVHGMCGWHAAGRALKRLDGRRSGSGSAGSAD